MKHAKHFLTGIALGLSLALACSGAVAAAGGGGGGDGEGQMVGNMMSDLAATERALCMRVMGRWRTIDRERMTPPSYDCMAHYHHNVSDGAFDRTALMPSRDDYNNWLLLRQAYKSSAAWKAGPGTYAQYVEGESPADWFGDKAASDRNAARVARNRKLLDDGWARVQLSDPFSAARSVKSQEDPMQAGSVKCGPAYADAVAGTKNASVRRALQAEYDKACGPEAQAARAKAVADAQARRAAMEPRIIEVAELEPMEPSMPAVQRDLNKIYAALQQPELKAVVFGVETAPQMTMLLDLSSKASWSSLAQTWPAIREGKLSVKAIPIAQLAPESAEIAALLATDRPNLMLRAWIQNGGNWSRTLAGCVKEQVQAEKIQDYTAPAADALAAAQAVVTRNTELILEGGIVGLPVAQFRVASGQSYMATKVAKPGNVYLFEAVQGIDELRYEQSLRDQLGAAVPKDSKTVGDLKAQVCAKPGGECWAAEGKVAKGWFD